MIALIQPNIFMLAGMSAATIYIHEMLVGLGYGDVLIITRDRTKRTNKLTHYGPGEIMQYYSINNKPKIVEMEYQTAYGALEDSYSAEFLDVLNSSELVISFDEGLALLPSVTHLKPRFYQYYHFPEINMPPSKLVSVICNSSFTARLATKYYGVAPRIIYPIPDGMQYYSSSDRDIDVLWVGRLANDKGLVALNKVAHHRDWRVMAVGSHWWGEHSPSEDEIAELKIVRDATMGELRSYYSRAKIILSTKGLNVNAEQLRMFEHFGITIAEGAYSGCIPLVHKSGGPYIDFLCQEQGGYGYYYENESSLLFLIDYLLTTPPSGIQRRALNRARSLYSYSLTSLLELIGKEGGGL
jgi:glycosyltransferase involved in cell wall biosynthesis